VFSIQHIVAPNPYNILDQVTYNAKDNIIQYQKNTEPMTTLLWGYNYQYPVAKIVGLSYANVLAALGQPLIDRVAQGTPSTTDMSTIRSAFASKNAMVTTYTYAPLIGMTSETDSKGYTIYYEYDGFGRLQYAKDKDGNVIKKYDYHYQGQ
jgi:YD repeat-containing protein